MEIFISYEFSNGKTVVNLHHADLLQWILDSCFRIRPFGCKSGCRKIGPVPVLVSLLLTIADSQLQRLYRHQVGFAKTLCDFRGCDDGTGRSVTHDAAVKQAQWIRDQGGSHDPVDTDWLSEMGLWIFSPVVITFYRYLCDRPFQVIIGHIVLGPVSARQLGKLPGS